MAPPLLQLSEIQPVVRDHTNPEILWKLHAAKTFSGTANAASAMPKTAHKKNLFWK